MLDMDQWYATHTRRNWHRFCNPQEVTVSAICEVQWRFQEQKLTSLSQVKTRSTWWSTISLTIHRLIPIKFNALNQQFYKQCGCRTKS
jgi:hypothetical protein